MYYIPTVVSAAEKKRRNCLNVFRNRTYSIVVFQWTSVFLSSGFIEATVILYRANVRTRSRARTTCDDDEIRNEEIIDEFVEMSIEHVSEIFLLKFFR